MAKSKKKKQNHPAAAAQAPAVKKQPAKSKASPKASARARALNIREHTSAGKFAWIMILAMVVIVPIIMANGPLSWMGFNFVDGFDGLKVFVLRVGIMVILAAWIWDVIMNGGEIRYHRVYILIGIFLAWIVITTFLSINPATAFLGKYRRYEGAWSYFLYALLLFLTMQYATSRVRIRQLARTLSLSSIVVAGYGLLQAIPNPFRTPDVGTAANWDPFTWGVLPFEPLRSFSTFGNPNLLAGYLAFTIFVTMGLLLSEDDQKWRRWYWVILIMNSAVAITAFSRSVWVAGFVTILIFAFLMWRQKVKIERDDLIFSGGLAAIVAAFIAYSLTRVDSVMNFWTRLHTIFEFNDGSGLTRFQIWDAAMAAIAQRPIFGYGLDTFRLIFRHFAPPEYAQAAGFRSVADNAHNFPLQMATGIGIVGLVLFYALLFWVAFIAIRYCLKKDDSDKSTKILMIGILSACIAYCIHLFFGLSLPGATFILWILMALLLIPTAKTVQISDKITGAAWLKPVGILLCVTLLIPVVFATRLAAADNAYAMPAGLVAAGVGQADIDTLRMVKAEAERTVRLNPFYERYYLDYFILTSHYALINLQNGTPEAQSLVQDAKERAVHLVDMSTWEYDSYLAVANFYMNLGQITGGEVGQAHYREAANFMADKIEFTPTGLALRVRYAEALMALGEIDAAREQLEFVVAHDTNYEQAAELLQNLNTQTGLPSSP